LIDHFQVGLVDEAAGIQSAAAPPATELTPRDSAQLGIHERDQLVEGTRLTLAMCQQN
jgi:hypothetical protein